MPKHHKLHDRFDSYMDAAKLRPCDATQLREIRRAFYAGATSFMGCLLDGIGQTPGDIPAEHEIDTVASLQIEIEAFQENIKHGRA